LVGIVLSRTRAKKFLKLPQMVSVTTFIYSVRVLGYRSGDPGSIPSTTRKKVVGLERGPLNLVSTTEELLDRKVAAPV
jgi:hypothetical protein